MEKAQCQMPAYGWQQYYIGIKQKIEYFWNRDEDSILCSKLLIAFRGIQSDPYNKWEFDRNGNIVRKRDEDSINNLVAFFLKLIMVKKIYIEKNHKVYLKMEINVAKLIF